MSVCYEAITRCSIHNSRETVYYKVSRMSVTSRMLLIERDMTAVFIKIKTVYIGLQACVMYDTDNISVYT